MSQVARLNTEMASPKLKKKEEEEANREFFLSVRVVCLPVRALLCSWHGYNIKKPIPPHTQPKFPLGVVSEERRMIYHGQYVVDDPMGPSQLLRVSRVSG